MIGLAYHNYPSSITTVTTTPLLYPIPAPMPYSCKFANVDIAYGRFHMEATPSQGQLPPSPNSHSLPAPLDRIRNLLFRLRAFTARPHTEIEDTGSIKTLTAIMTTTREDMAEDNR